MAAYRRVYDSCHLQADCQEPGSAPERYGRQSSMGYFYLFYCTLLFQNVSFVEHNEFNLKLRKFSLFLFLWGY